uniref:adenine phosphoribosyltransferase n=1 Tax=Leptobrachium leishanense TaxID=445787 RepID=A0A8C5MPB2_9ANUR
SNKSEFWLSELLPRSILSPSTPLDITPVLKDPAVFRTVIDLFEVHVRANYTKVDLIAGLDSRGFLFGPALAQRINVGFIMIRKKGKLPGLTESVSYSLEYGKVSDPFLILPIFFSGTMSAACELLTRRGAEILDCLVLIELLSLRGADKLKPHRTHSLLAYD